MDNRFSITTLAYTYNQRHLPISVNQERTIGNKIPYEWPVKGAKEQQT